MMNNLLLRDPETLKASVDVALFALHYQEVLNQGKTNTTYNSTGSTGVTQDVGKMLKQLQSNGVSLIRSHPNSFYIVQSMRSAETTGC
jgi:hypothetical protein